MSEMKWLDHRSNWQQKAVREEEKRAQKKRAARFGISPKPGGNVTKPAKYAAVPDGKFADPVNYRYPLSPQARAINAVTRFNDIGNKAAGGYNDAEWAKMGGRIAKANGKGYSYDAKKKIVVTPGTAPKEE